MLLSKKQQWIIFITVNIAAVAFVLLFPVYLEIVPNMPTMSKCQMVEVFHFYCPGCGGTRAVKAVLSLDLISAFKFNPTVAICAVLFVFYELAMIVHLVIGKARKTFAKPVFGIILIAVWVIYALARNVLLVCGIDLLGDIL